MTKPILVIGTGGTIAMSAGEKGLLPSRTVGDLLDDVRLAVPGIEFRTQDAFNKPSANISFEDVEGIARIIAKEADAGCQGAVLVQGTDTIEETAFALELLGSAQIPVIVTGAMRGASSLGADGPANLRAAIIAARDSPQGLGTIVVLDDEAHAARWVRKAHTTSTGAFSSGDEGLLGRIHEGVLRTTHRQLAPISLPAGRQDHPWPRIVLLKIAMADDGGLLEAIPQMGFDGCVIEAMGAGHVPARLAPLIGALTARMPVVMASRTGAGRICTNTYAYPGSETDLISRGVLPAGNLSGLKARVLLAACFKRCGAEAPDIFREIAARL